MARQSTRPALPDEVAQLIVRARRSVWHSAARRLTDVGESMLLWQVVSHLSRAGECNQRELADAIAQHPAGVSRVLEELEERGFAVRQRDPKDRRAHVVALTAAGRRFREKLAPAVECGMQEALAGLSSAELRTLKQLLSKISERAS